MAVSYKKLLNFYETAEKQLKAGTKDANYLIYGALGTGKTSAARGAKLPILMDCFDPQGWLPLKELIESGNCIVNSYDAEIPSKPRMYLKWKEDFEKKVDSGIFDITGTYVLDSATTFGQCIMGQVLKEAGRAGSSPFQQDYNPAMTKMMDAIRRILAVPCTVIVIAHEAVEKDDLTGQLERTPDFVGKLRTGIPLLFTEIWHTTVSVDSKGNFQQTFQTQTDKRVSARTRVGGFGVYEPYEKLSFQALRRKAGLSMENLPSYKEVLNQSGQNTEEEGETK